MSITEVDERYFRHGLRVICGNGVCRGQVVEECTGLMPDRMGM